MKSNTKERIVEAAARRFYRDGFRNVGIDQVLTDVGISKTAFYKHFESKDDLMLAALEMKNVWLQDTFRQLVRERGGPEPREQLLALFDVVGTIIDSEEYQGCIFVNVAIEFPLPHEPAHRAAAQNKQAIENFVAELAEQSGARDPRTLAKELCLIMEGAYVTRLVNGNRQAADIARRVACATIESHLSGADTERVSNTG